ncbi:PREDICTED: uncharacterized protein LOC107116620 [Gekko japonicus]|uniref:Uncharacterized protein LOC107116620 n=1 Tax=Gekko japonicus TaxID=146911 RepID=A0ABM1KK19_GEKJA|nr:PREDICTED: uncharacterized protein LOC107116620 [Gekko japonicus]
MNYGNDWDMYLVPSYVGTQIWGVNGAAVLPVAAVVTEGFARPALGLVLLVGGEAGQIVPRVAGPRLAGAVGGGQVLVGVAAGASRVVVGGPAAAGEDGGGGGGGGGGLLVEASEGITSTSVMSQPRPPSRAPETHICSTAALPETGSSQMNTGDVCRGALLSGRRFWLAGAPSTLTAVVLAAPETNRPPFGARRSRKLARLRAENLPLQCFESNLPHLPAEELEIAIQDPRSGRLLEPNLHAARLPIDSRRAHEHRGWGGGTEKPERSEAGLS